MHGAPIPIVKALNVAICAGGVRVKISGLVMLKERECVCACVCGVMEGGGEGGE